MTTLKVIAKMRGLSQSDLAKMAGLSRQAVSLWFKKTKNQRQVEINLQTKHLQKLSQSLHIRIDDLMNVLPCLDDLSYMESCQTSLLWDHLYPSVEDFVISLVRHEPRAMGRLVEIFGLFQAEKLIGNSVWKNFHKYKKHIHPIRRKECEHLWNLQKNLNLN